MEADAASWERNRGKPLEIQTPPVDFERRYFSCCGPFYWIAGDPRHAVCPHLAEIGD
jgi:hypothetical protein